MLRRKFLKGSAGAAAGAAAVAGTGIITGAPAIAQGREKLVLVTSWGRGLAGVHDAAQRFADSVNTMSEGTLEIDLKANGELVSGFGQFDAVTAGQADMYHAADYYYVGQHPAFAFFTAVPFGMTAPELHNWYYHMGGHDLHREVGEELGKLGASVQALPGSEVYQALASGALDGTEWIGPWADEKAGFQEITKKFYTSGFHEPGAGLSVAVNADRFNALKPAHQKMIEIAAAESNQFTLHQFLANNSEALDRLTGVGVETLEFPDDVWDAFGKASQEVLDENMDDELFAKVFDSVQSSMKLSSRWTDLSDRAYTTQRDRVLG